MSEAVVSQVAQSEDEFEPGPAGWQKRWLMEFKAARKELKKWLKAGEQVVARYLDEREGSEQSAETRWNLFGANVDTLKSLLYGKTPTVDVGRQFSDATDDLARIGGEMLQRLCNLDIEQDDDYSAALEYALEDHLLPGIGNARCRYVVETEDVPEEPAQTQPVLDELGQPAWTSRPAADAGRPRGDPGAHAEELRERRDRLHPLEGPALEPELARFTRCAGGPSRRR
jgi:hypothetical protein